MKHGTWCSMNQEAPEGYHLRGGCSCHCHVQARIDAMEPGERLAHDLHRADLGVLRVVADWMLDRGWTEPL